MLGTELWSTCRWREIEKEKGKNTIKLFLCFPCFNDLLSHAPILKCSGYFDGKRYSCFSCYVSLGFEESYTYIWEVKRKWDLCIEFLTLIECWLYARHQAKPSHEWSPSTFPTNMWDRYSTDLWEVHYSCRWGTIGIVRLALPKVMKLASKGSDIYTQLDWFWSPSS